MSRKSQFQAIMAKVHSTYKNHAKAVEAIKNSEDFTDKYKNELIETRRTELNAMLATLYDKATNIVTEAKQEAAGEAERTLRKLGKPEMQQQLANALKIFELTGKTMKAEDIQAVAAPFTSSPAITQALQAALIKGGRKPGGFDSDINSLFPADTRSKITQTLDDVQGLIDKANKSGHYDGLDGARTNMHYVDECTNKLTDDLSCIDTQGEE